MCKKTIALGLLFGLVGFAALTVGCGQQTSTATTTTTTLATSSGVTIKGTSAGGSTSLGLRRFATGLTTAEVTIGVPIKGSDEVTIVARGTTDSDGNYSITVATASLESLKTGSGNTAANVVITISSEGTVIGCVLPSISLEAGGTGYAPTASKGDYKKAMIARAAFKKGQDPKNFDYSGSIDTKFSSESMKDYTPDQVDDMADSIKAGEDAEAKIGAALGITDEKMDLMRKKGFELHRTYIEPLMQAAFATKTPPNRAAMDAAFASMEAKMTEYARDTLGISGQAIADFKSMKDKQMEAKMGESSFLKNDDSFKEAQLRMSGDKMINMFLGQWDAADTIANLATAEAPKSFRYNPASAAVYTSFVASKESIKTELLNKMSTSGTSLEAIPNYMRTAFFDRFLFPAMADKPQEKQGGGFDQASMEAKMGAFTNTRITVYFMNTFLNQQQRMTYFTSQETAMQPIFQNRFGNSSSPYYMGLNFWNGSLTGGTPPTPDQVSARLALYKAALDAAMDNNTTLKNIFIAAGFTDTQATTILKAFRILMAPPDAM